MTLGELLNDDCRTHGHDACWVRMTIYMYGRPLATICGGILGPVCLEFTAAL